MKSEDVCEGRLRHACIVSHHDVSLLDTAHKASSHRGAAVRAPPPTMFNRFELITCNGVVHTDVRWTSRSCRHVTSLKRLLYPYREIVTLALPSSHVSPSGGFQKPFQSTTVYTSAIRGAELSPVHELSRQLLPDIVPSYSLRQLLFYN